MIDINTEKVQNNIKALKSNNPLLIKNILVDIRENGQMEYVPILIDLILENKNSELSQIIKAFISDIKDSNIKAILTEYIENNKYKHIRKDLLSICWESAVDFSDMLDLFIEIVINDEFENSFESLTVLENLDGYIEIETIEHSISKLQNSIKDVSESKQYIINESIKVLQKRIA